MAYRDEYLPEEEEDGGVLGTLGGLAAAGALATPMGRPVRRIAGNYAQAFADPLGSAMRKNQRMSNVMDSGVDLVSRAKQGMRGGLNTATGGLSEMAGRDYAQRAAKPTSNVPYPSETAENWADTKRNFGAAGKTFMDALGATPQAGRNVGLDLSKEAIQKENRAMLAKLSSKQEAQLNKFMKTPAGKSLSTDEYLELRLNMKDKRIKDPLQAALYVLSGRPKIPMANMDGTPKTNRWDAPKLIMPGDPGYTTA